MGKAGVGIGVSAGGGFASGLLSGLAAGATLGPWGALIGGIIGAAVGAGVAGATLLLNRQPDDKKRKTQDVIETNSIHILPVPVAFGRCRAGGNWLAVGTFFKVKDRLGATPGRRLAICNAILGICEAGPNGLTAMGNIWQDGQTPFMLAQAEKQPIINKYEYHVHRGTSTEALDAFVTATGLKDSMYAVDPVPFRNTATAACRTIVGEKARMPGVNIDLVAPDCAIRRAAITTETAKADQVGYAFFDSYSDFFYYTLTGSTGTSAPYGLVGIGRQGQTRVHTPPPTGFGSVAHPSATHAWYLGRHDVLVMQDSVDPSTFWIGQWGIAANDARWEKHQPSLGQGGLRYEVAMTLHYLDEVSGILHSFHDAGFERYVMRWWLLTGKVERQTTNLGSGSYSAMIWSPDLNCYVFASGSARLDFVETDGGTIFNTVTALATSGCKGLCVSGQLIGVITVGALNYYDPTHLAAKGPYGTSSGDFSIGALGSSSSTLASVHQNSFTGHVTLGRYDGTDAFFVNFIPSIDEDKRDLNANGSAGLGGLPDPTLGGTNGRAEVDFQDFTTGYFITGDTTAAWARDWSYRTYNSFNLVALQGHSSLAGAAWASLVDEPSIDSRRWGSGLNAKYFSLGSFEGLHWYCTGAMQFTNPEGTFRYAERYKFDFFLDQEQSAASFVADDILVCCQGYRTVNSGVMHVGVEKSGAWAIWHFSEKNIIPESDGSSSLQIAFAGRTDAPNRVRVQYRDILNEYSHDYAEADDEWDQNSLGKIQASTVTAEGCGRFDSANFLAKQILDNAKGARRRVSFKTHFTALLLAPGDLIEVSDARCALSRLPCKVISIVEQGGDQSIEIVALEHRPTLDALSAAVIPTGTPGSGPTPPENDTCDSFEAPADSTTVIWLNGGATIPIGNVVVNYQSGTYAPASTGWNFAVSGFEIVTRDSSGAIVVLGAAPAVSISAPGWPDQGTAEQTNLGQTATYALAAAGPIGIRRTGAGGVFVAGSNFPTYQICIG